MKAAQRPLLFRIWNPESKTFLSLDINASLPFLHRSDLSVEQFSGILDKNGGQVYEGDIVKFSWSTWEHEIEWEVDEVFFDNGIFYLGRRHLFATNDCNFNEKTLEIVGNIHENPELLTKN